MGLSAISSVFVTTRKGLFNLSLFLCLVIAIVLFWLFLLAVCVQLGYAWFFFRRVYSIPGFGPVTADVSQGVSVIVCARNEAANLEQNLPSILMQQYPGPFEVIVVDDASTDLTATVLSSFREHYAHLRVVTILPGEQRELKGKKYALGKGVAAAKYEWLLLTDADCLPAGELWLRNMVAPLAAGKEIVAGYGGYNENSGWLNAFVRWESLHTFLQYSTYQLAGIPYMAVGRNMACTRLLFRKAQGHTLWNKLPSGDDDMLVRISATRENMAVVCNPEAFTYSHTKEDLRSWAAQKQRHLSTGKYYRVSVKLLLGLYAVSHAIMWLTYGLCFISGIDIQLRYFVIGLLIVRCVVYFRIWTFTATQLQETGNFMSYPFMAGFPLFDVGWMIYNFVFFPYITWKNKLHWT